MSNGPQQGQSFTTASGGVMQQGQTPHSELEAAANKGYAGVAGPSADAQAGGMSDVARRYLENQYNLHAAGNTPGQREFAEKVLKPALAPVQAGK